MEVKCWVTVVGCGHVVERWVFRWRCVRPGVIKLWIGWKGSPSESGCGALDGTGKGVCAVGVVEGGGPVGIR